ncbi:hypothetical protein HAL013_15070 [Helicobacter ailurogastricus]|uniref:Uncharacterized protein n=1 Tax=Helicobacter ailurogastricus TaxID=1578720 RepID=A0A0K2X7D9_9HELI|nr:hypothetical protein HAL011_13750 [Helicobacter ailurogastricus]CRF43280.1 hypothetical protein HAL013_15070 [Helicobacter ailurogastricus]CRF44453.1 hypothetical protein HAL09_10380 [Helicobacter ailurogastricus]
MFLLASTRQISSNEGLQKVLFVGLVSLKVVVAAHKISCGLALFLSKLENFANPSVFKPPLSFKIL